MPTEPPLPSLREASSLREAFVSQGTFSLSGKQRLAEPSPVRRRGSARLDADHLDGDMIGPRRDMGPELVGHRVHVSPEHQVVHEAVAAAVLDLLV